MNGKDLLDIMSQVDDDLITKTEIPPEKNASPISPVSARKAPSRRIYAGMAAGIAAAILVGIGLAAWSTNGFGLLKSKENTEVTSAPATTGYYPVSTTTPPEFTTTPPETTGYYPTTEEPPMTTMPTDTSVEPTITHHEIDLEQVLFAPDEKTGNVPDDWGSASDGAVQIPAALMEEISKPENRDRYFAISINISHFVCVDEYMAGHHPYIPDEELAEMFAEQIRMEALSEMDRLRILGYNIDALPYSGDETDPSYVYDGYSYRYRCHVYNGFTVTGYMTGEQISDFVADSAHGYRFTWDTKEAHVDLSEKWDS